MISVPQIVLCTLIIACILIIAGNNQFNKIKHSEFNRLKAIENEFISEKLNQKKYADNNTNSAKINSNIAVKLNTIKVDLLNLNFSFEEICKL